MRHNTLKFLMRIVSTLVVLRLLLVIALPALAVESDSVETLTKTKIKNQEIIEVFEKERLVTFSDSILTNQQAPDQESLSVYGSKIKGYSSSKTANEAVYGKKMDILVTGYSSTPDQCWGNPFITASGARVHVGTMACPPEYAFGTKIEIDGMGTYVCEDRGGAIKGNHFDMWFESRGEALQWGKRIVEARIIQ